MASTGTSPTDYEQALDGLARAIRTRQPACPPRETARQLLEYENPGHTGLVGVDFEATRAVLYHERDRDAIAVPFDADGLGDGGPKIAHFEGGRRLVDWVDRMDAYWGWLNPRFR